MKKFLKWFGIIFLLLLILVIALPFMFKGKIITMIKEETNKSLNAKVDFGDVSLSLIKNFPNFSISISGLSVINAKPFEGDTLLYTKELQIVVDVMSVISGDQVRIRKVVLENAVVNCLVNEEGKANWDIAKPSSEPQSASAPSAFKANLNYYAIKNAHIVYDDRTMGFRLVLEEMNHEGKGDFTQDLFLLSTHTEAARATMNYGGMDYLSKVKTKIDADLEMDMKSSKYTFKDNKIALNDLNLGFSGSVSMPDTNIDMDLKFSAQQSDFKNFISLVPGVYAAEFSNAKAGGKMAFDGWAKGRFNAVSMPGFGLKLDIDNGSLKYPSLPSDLKNVFVNLDVQNPDGNLDHTSVNLSRMHVEMAGDPFDARLILKTPISDPDFDASLKGKIDFGSIGKIVPLEKGTMLSGILTADFAAKGKYSYVKQSQYDKFTASGNIGITGMNYNAAGMKTPVQVNQLSLVFNTKSVSLTALNMKAGKTDIQATGSLENFIPYALKDETLKGNLKMTSPKIDLNEWISEDEKAASTGDTAAMSAPELPGNIDFTLNASIGQLIYTNMNMMNCSGEIVLRDKSIYLNNLKLHMLDGSVLVNGIYSGAKPKSPDVSFDFNISDFDLKKTAATFATVDKIAPVVSSCQGKFSCGLKMKAGMDDKMNVIMNTLNGGGKLTTSTVVISGSNTLEKGGDVLKMDQLKKLTVPVVNVSFTFSDGRLYVQPFDVVLAGIKTTISGSNGFDQTLDYKLNMNIPRAAFGSAANSVLNGFISQANSKGVNISAGDNIPVAVKIGGTCSNPKISTDLSSAGSKAVDNLKAAAAAEFEKKKAEAEARARAEVDKLKSEAEKKVNEQKAKAQAEADRIKKEAEAKIKAEQDKAKKEAEKKAKEELNKLNPFKKGE
ncbi:MAG: AsmA family protein [Bacteroidetes bacterium]|nr:AsmA family protein [Bacteroidota bacterium]